MPWNSTWPIGSISVKDNEGPGQQNTNYIKDTMGGAVVGTNLNTTTDHFWDVSADLNGHHRFMKCAPFTVGGLPTDPIFDNTAIGGVYYAKTKLAAESTAQQDVQCFFKNSTNIMQLLGIRAMAVFNAAGTISYSHNVTSVAADGGTGRYRVNFTAALPSENYLVLGGAIRNDASLTSELLFEVQGAVALATVKSTTFVRVMTRSDGGTGHAPLQAWLICFGG